MNLLFEKIESIQYKAVLTLTSAIQSTWGLESLKSERLFRLLSCMFKMIKNKAPEYLNFLIRKRKQIFNSRKVYNPSLNCRTKYFKSFFFPASLEKWFNLNPNIRNSETINTFKQKLLPFICPLENSIFNNFDLKRLKLLANVLVLIT